MSMFPKELAKDKGDEGGSCNRTSCQAPDSAHYYNKMTQRWYCLECAGRINASAWHYDQVHFFDFPEKYKHIFRDFWRYR